MIIKEIRKKEEKIMKEFFLINEILDPVMKLKRKKYEKKTKTKRMDTIKRKDITTIKKVGWEKIKSDNEKNETKGEK